MASLLPGFEYDVFISYRQKDNKYDGWVTEFVTNLQKELESTFKEDISVYFDINPHDGLLETHDVDASLKHKLKCLVFIPIISRTYCDPKSFAWEHEFKAFVKQASQDHYGLKVTLPNGNVVNRILPIRIYDLDYSDLNLFESVLGGVLRGVEFIYLEPGVNRPLKPDDSERLNLNKTKYRNQINKVGNAINDIISGLKIEPAFKSVKDKPQTGQLIGKIRNEQMDLIDNYDPKKTQVGIQPDNRFNNKSNKYRKSVIEACPKCKYPLRIKPEISSPCPNCGYTGDQVNTVFDSGKTIPINSLHQDFETFQEFKFRLIKEDDNSEIEIQSPDEPEVILNRSHLDVNNATISADHHVIIKYVNQKIYLEDVSSSGASFIQAKSKMAIKNNTKLVIGNKMYLFDTPENLLKDDFSGSTRKLGEFGSGSGQSVSGFILTDVSTGKRKNFEGNNVILNRAMLDSGNNSISSSRHTKLEFSGGQWYVKDCSSNESTFIQIKSEQLLENKIRIILGNKIFRFEYI